MVWSGGCSARGQNMIKIRRTFVLFGVLGLGGCGLTPQQETQLAVQQASADDATCKSYGAQPGSDAYFGCRTNLADVRAQQNMANTQAAATELADHSTTLPRVPTE
jgi:hypothetical protein